MKTKREIETLLRKYKAEYKHSGQLVHERDIEILEWILELN
jgi:hypothetical protein